MRPLIEITELGFANGNRVFAKCENRNPQSHSHYDRIFDYLFDECIAKRGVSKETHLFESSSGNAGTSFAKFCDLYGFRGTVIFPKTVRQKRIDTIQTRRVNVVVSPYDEYMKGARKTMTALVNSARDAGERVHIVNHSQLWESVIAMKNCGRELISEFEQRRLIPDYFISALGNGTSTSGIGLPLKAWNSDLRIIGFEPMNAPVYALKLGRVTSPTFRVSELTGTGVWGIRFPNLDVNLLSDIQLVDDGVESQSRWLSYVERVEKVFGESIGHTSAASICVAHDMAERVRGKNILVVFYDIKEFY